MTLKEVYAHFNAQDAHYDISRNSPESQITTLNYSGFKTICNLSDDEKSGWEVRMADFKRSLYLMFTELAEVITNEKFIIRLQKNDDFLEVYDTMFRDLTDEEIVSIHAICDKHELGEKGYTCLIINFTMPVVGDQIIGDKNTCMMFKWLPKDMDAKLFFGYII